MVRFSEDCRALLFSAVWACIACGSPKMKIRKYSACMTFRIARFCCFCPNTAIPFPLTLALLQHLFDAGAKIFKHDGRSIATRRSSD